MGGEWREGGREQGRDDCYTYYSDGTIIIQCIQTNSEELYLYNYDVTYYVITFKLALWCVRYLMGNSYFRPAQSSKPFDTSAHWFEPVGNWENILYAEFASSCDLQLHGGRYSAIMYQKRFFNLLTRGQCMFMHCYFVSGPTEN